MRIFITGGTGFIGSYLSWLLRERGHEVRPQSRRIDWAAAQGCEAVINLAGENIAKGRWTAARKQALRDSRLETTRRCVELKPKVLLSASAVGYYGDRGEELLTEDSPPGAGFLAELCRDWEKEANYAQPYGTRVVLLRTAVVLGPGGGALAKMLLPFKLGLGGPIGSGKQWMSWIAREDWAEAALQALTQEVAGAVNLSAPDPVRQKDFAKALGRALGRPAFLPMPKLALRAAVGELASELTASQRVRPWQAYRFKLGLDAALRASL